MRFHPVALCLVALCLLALGTSGCDRPSAVPREVAWPRGEEWVLPTTRCRDFFTVEARINGTGPWRLLLDTGTGETLLDPRLRARVAPGAIDSLRVGAFVARRVAVEEQEMGALSNALGLHLDGIVGHPVFAGGAITYDYPAGEVRLSRRRLSAGQAGVAPIRTRRRPVVQARIGGETVGVLIDTGSSQGLSLTRLHRFALAERPVPTGARVRVDGVHRLRTARLSARVHLGPVRLDGPIVHESPAMELVGTRILRHFVVTFDQRGGLVAFARPEAHVSEPLPPETEWSLGMALQARATGHEVLEVFPGSPAAHAGLLPGDRIVGEGGASAPAGRCAAAPVELPPPPPGPVRLTVERGGGRHEVVLTPVPVVGG